MMTQAQAKTIDGHIRVSPRIGREGPGDTGKDVQREPIAAAGRWA